MSPFSLDNVYLFALYGSLTNLNYFILSSEQIVETQKKLIFNCQYNIDLQFFDFKEKAADNNSTKKKQ